MDKHASNKAKAKGLQKLRFWCQICSKQCRDDNGFKCHIASETHIRQMHLFAENSKGMIDNFSKEFLKGFMDILSQRHSTNRVKANNVYQEYIAYKEHVHMNATIWTSLTEFCIYLGKEGKAVVDETEKGWFIQYIDRDPRVLARQAQSEQKQKSELDDEERARRMIQAQIQVAEQLKRDREMTELTATSSSAVPQQEGDPGVQNVIKLKLGMQAAEGKKRKLALMSAEVFGEEAQSSALSSSSSSLLAMAATLTTPADNVLEQIKREEESRRMEQLKLEDKKDRRQNWLHPGIVVRIMNKKLSDGRFYKAKGTILQVINDFLAEIRVDGAIVRLDQADLETVIPKVGSLLMVVNGRSRGMTATLLRIHQDTFNCDIRVEEGVHIKRELLGVDYEDVCRLATDNS